MPPEHEVELSCQDSQREAWLETERGREREKGKKREGERGRERERKKERERIETSAAVGQVCNNYTI